MRHSLFSLSVLFAPVFGALSPDLINLAQKYAPQFRLNPDEKYFPSSIEYMLPHYSVYDNNGKPLATQPSPLTTSNIDTVVGKGASTWLTVSDTGAGYLTGLNPSTNKVPVYTFIVPKEGGIVDLFYWTFYPYNLGKNIPALGYIGNHIGDWERMTVRTRNGVAISADYNAHSSGTQGAGTKLWSDVRKPSGEDRPLGYVASGSHGIWPGPGSWVYQDVVVYQLKDETRDGGPTWDGKDNIYPLEYLPSSTYSGEQAWLNYQGNWGNKGRTDCWWYFMVKTCPLSDGPGGPYRQDVFTASSLQGGPGMISKYSDMKGALSQTLAPLAINSSTSFYKLRLDSSALQLIDLASFTHLTVGQTCLEQRSNNATIVTTTYGTSQLNTGDDRVYSITVPRCISTSGHVDSYKVGLCTAADSAACSWAQSRQLRTYLTGKPGVTNGTAIKLDMDDDNWTWN